MNTIELKETPAAPDMVRVSRSKIVSGIGPNTIRKWHGMGLPLYHVTGCTFYSQSELAAFIRARPGTKSGGGQ